MLYIPMDMYDTAYSLMYELVYNIYDDQYNYDNMYRTKLLTPPKGL